MKLKLHHLRLSIGVIAMLAAATALLIWPMSYVSYDRVNIPLPVVHHIVIGWGGGDLLLQVVTGNGLYIDSHYWRDHHSSSTDFGRAGGKLGGFADISFSHYTLDLGSGRPRPFTAYTLHVPLWMPAVAAATLSSICLIGLRRLQRGFEVRSD